MSMRKFSSEASVRLLDEVKTIYGIDTDVQLGTILKCHKSAIYKIRAHESCLNEKRIALLQSYTHWTLDKIEEMADETMEHRFKWETS